MNAPDQRGDRSRAGAESLPESEQIEGFASNFYQDRSFDMHAVKIMPGEFYVTGKDMLLVTVLGSCVAACIRDHESGVGGINHFMLPDGGNKDIVSSAARYGAHAMELLINHLLKAGARRSRLEAKVFGGGAVLGNQMTCKIGERNADFVLKFLKTENIPVIAKDLLDSYPRKVYFFPSSGRVLVRKLHRVHNDTLFSRERDYRRRIDSEKVEGDIELFS